MQTYLPSPIFSDTARMLDTQTLGFQRLDNLQILTSLLIEPGFVEKRLEDMWRGYEWVLLDYQKTIVNEWTRRGNPDSCLWKSYELFRGQPSRRTDLVPYWLGKRELHESHQSNLIKSNPEYYGPLFGEVASNLPFVWPATIFSPVPF